MNGHVLGFIVIAVIMTAASFLFIAWPVMRKKRETARLAAELAPAAPAAPAVPAQDTAAPARLADVAATTTVQQDPARPAVTALDGLRAASPQASLSSVPPSVAAPPQVSAARSRLDQLQTALDAGVLSAEQFEEGKREIGRRLLEQVMGTESAPAEAPGRTARAKQKAKSAQITQTAPSQGTPAQPDDGRVARLVGRLRGRFHWPSFSGRGRPALVALGVVVLCVVAAGLAGVDLLWRNPASLSPEAASSAQGDNSPHGLDPAKVRAMAAQLEEKLKTNPNDGAGWAMLARSYNAIGEYEQAVNAYKKAAAIITDDPQLLVDYADALAVSQGRKLEGEPMKLVERALELDPDNVKGLALKATELFDRKDYSGAIALWERCITVMPANNEELVKQLRANIIEAKTLGGAGGASESTASAGSGSPGPASSNGQTTDSATAADSGQDAGAPSGGSASLSGVVTLADSLADKVSPNDTVFIFARPVSGPRMPVALLKRQVKDLPLQFTLDESSAMMPTLTLAQYPNVLVGARVAKSGDAIPRSGDLEGTSGPVKVGANDVRIEISRVVP